MNIYCDSSTQEACLVFEEEEPIIIPYETKVTNNVGEYRAVIEAMNMVLSRKLKEANILTDSEFVVNQVMGFDKSGNIWKKCKPQLLPLRNQVRALMNTAQDIRVTLSWIPREENLAGRVLEH